MNEDKLTKIKDWLMEHLTTIVLVIITISSISLSVYYVYTNKCEECPVCEDNIESTKPLESKLYKVDVKGSVKKPSVYTLEDDATVLDAINMAGGLTKDGTTENINLSKKVKDEMVIYVFTKKELKDETSTNQVVCEVPKCSCEKISVRKDIYTDSNSKSASKTSSKAASANTNTIVSINTGTLEELTTLSGIGTSKAQAIIDYRNSNGPFKTISDITKVKGIGNALFEKIKSRITI